MPRPRTGQLVRKPSGNYFSRVLLKDNSEAWINLETRDPVKARVLHASLVARANDGTLTRADVDAMSVPPETFATFARRWVEGRIGKVQMAEQERAMLERDVIPTIGGTAVQDIEREHVEAVLQAAIARGLSLSSVGALKRLVHRTLAGAIKAKLIKANHASGIKVSAKLPEFRAAHVDNRRRAVPTDDEMIALWKSPDVSIVLKLVALVARQLGGARTVETSRLDWLDVDRETFATCTLPRGKGKGPQLLDLPSDVGANLAAWWQESGRPESGPVFPVERGPRKGEAKRNGTSYAARLRRAFKLAGVTRRELFEDTARTRRCDFHSMRRAFVTALVSTEGVNAQLSMQLAGHSNAQTHARYVAETPKMRRVPAAALPPQGVRILPAPTGAETSSDHHESGTRNSYASTGTDDESPCIDAQFESSSVLEGRRSIRLSYERTPGFPGDREDGSDSFPHRGAFSWPVHLAMVAESITRWPDATASLLAFASL